MCDQRLEPGYWERFDDISGGMEPMAGEAEAEYTENRSAEEVKKAYDEARRSW